MSCSEKIYDWEGEREVEVGGEEDLVEEQFYRFGDPDEKALTFHHSRVYKTFPRRCKPRQVHYELQLPAYDYFSQKHAVANDRE
uniref:Uncharacterized protein n=1 Tax=Parascaris univalens TaxID=6257 RepID=A0A915AYX6_PARUN